MATLNDHEKMNRTRSTLLRDDNGFPVLFTHTEKEKDRSELPEIVTPDATSGPAEWGRYHDAVRDAARQFDDPDEGDIHHFLRARARSPERVDAPAFHEAVKRQRMADLVDILDHHMRRDGSLPRGSRMVRVQAPKGYLRKAIRQASPEDLAHLHHRLASIGHDPEKVGDYLKARAKPDMWDQATALQINFADDEFDGLTFDGGDSDFDGALSEEELIENFRRIAASLPAPIVNVYIDNKPQTEES